jgi:hypothetical protein
MLSALTRRIRQWFPRPTAPVSDLAEASDPGSEEAEWQALIAAAKRRVPPPLPPPRSVRMAQEAQEEREWEAAIRRAKAQAPLAARTAPTLRPAPLPRQADPEERLWREAIARAKAVHARTAPAGKPPRKTPDEWGPAIAAAKRRHGLRIAA